MELAPEPFVDAETVAAHLGVVRMTVYRWIRDFDLPSHKLGRLRKFKISEVDRWVQSRCITPTPDERADSA
jgi:excisionase family DNA binding protein